MCKAQGPRSAQIHQIYIDRGIFLAKIKTVFSRVWVWVPWILSCLLIPQSLLSDCTSRSLSVCPCLLSLRFRCMSVHSTLLVSRSSLDGRLLCWLLEVVVVGQHLDERIKIQESWIKTHNRWDKITKTQPKPPWRGSQSEGSEVQVCLLPSSYRNLPHILQSFRPGFPQPESHWHETRRKKIEQSLSTLKVEEFVNREGAASTNDAAIGEVCVTTDTALCFKDVWVTNLQAFGAASYLCTFICNDGCVLP